MKVVVENLKSKGGKKENFRMLKNIDNEKLL